MSRTRPVVFLCGVVAAHSALAGDPEVLAFEDRGTGARLEAVGADDHIAGDVMNARPDALLLNPAARDTVESVREGPYAFCNFRVALERAHSNRHKEVPQFIAQNA